MFYPVPVFCIVLSHWIHRGTRRHTSAPSATTHSALNPGYIHCTKAISNPHTVQHTHAIYSPMMHNQSQCSFLFCTALNSTRKRVKETPGSSVKRRAVAKDSRARMLWKSIKEMFTQVGSLVSPCVPPLDFWCTHSHAFLFLRASCNGRNCPLGIAVKLLDLDSLQCWNTFLITCTT